MKAVWFLVWSALVLLPLFPTQPAEESLQIICDQTSLVRNCRADAGFSCLIRYSGRTILFDTGSDGDILLGNMAGLGIDPAKIDLVFISHNHSDHIGGLASFLAVNRHAEVIMPEEMASNTSGRGGDIFKQAWTAAKARRQPLPRNTEAYEWSPGIFGSGLLTAALPNGMTIQEQALILDTSMGLVQIVGCSHPGPAAFIRQVRKHFDRPVRLLIGGLHLQGPGMDDPRIRSIMGELKNLGVESLAPLHCSGDRSRIIAREYFAEQCLTGGVGRFFPLQTEKTAVEVFMPEVFEVHGHLHGRIVFSPDERECLWDLNTAQMRKHIILRRNDAGKWDVAEPSFLSPDWQEKEPAYTADGQGVIYQSRCPISGSGDINLWQRKRLGSEWGQARPLGGPVNTPDTDETSPWLGADGSLVFCRDNNPVVSGASGGSDIFLARCEQGRYRDVERLGPEINSEFQEANPVLAPDGSFLLFTSNRPGGYSRMMNLYVSRRLADGSWDRSSCLSWRLGIDNIWFPSLSPDGCYLYFCGGYPTQQGYTASHYFRVQVEELIPEAKSGLAPNGQRRQPL